MTSQGSKTAREIATAVLNQFDPRHNYAGPILSKMVHQTTERQRATDLVFSTIRNRAIVDKVITQFADCPVERIQPRLLNIIRIASFELLYSPQTPEYSIVNEAVNAARALTGRKQTAFVNAVLRQISRHIKNRQIPLSQAVPKSTLPQTPLTGCQFDTDILPDPNESPADYFSTTFSLPKWLIIDWLNEFSPEQVRQICFASNRRPSIYIRPNTLKITTQQLAKKFSQADIDFEIIPNVIPAEAGIQKSNDADASMIKIRSPRTITELLGFTEGLFTVQDITASLPVRLLKPQPEWTILDSCAAPGTKTMQLAELTGDKATIIATDIDSDRLKKVKENTARLGITSVSIIPYEQAEHKAAEIGLFDAVLLDVPCSNTGVLAKRIEARYRINTEAIKQLSQTQGNLLTAAAKMIKPNGKICYSTCSIQKAENNQLVKGFLQKNADFELESELLTLPSVNGIDYDGGYVAIIARK